MFRYFCRFVLILWMPTVWTSSCPFSEDLIDDATQIYEQRLQYEEVVWENYHMGDSDPASVFFAEFGVNSDSVEEFRKANILIDYQRLIRENYGDLNGSCDAIAFCEFQSVLEEHTECTPEEARCSSKEMDCNSDGKWRTFDGTCNNVANWKWGAQNMEYNRWVNATFDDGINSIRRTAKSNEDLVSPRVIGNIINSTSQINSNYSGNEVVPNVFAIMFGQAIAHDLGNRAINKIKGDGAKGIRCCSKSYDKPLSVEQRSAHCLPIHVPEDDEFYSKHNIGCLNFIRAQSTLANDCKLKGAPKVNSFSSYLDMHIVYSNSFDQIKSMRNMTGGLLTTNANNILPDGPAGYKAGDGRVNQTPWLALTHSMLFRLHNYIAQQLAAVNPDWNDDVLFNECRRINIAIYEHLIYNEWLVTLVGREFLESRNLTGCSSDEESGAYDASVDASNMDEFAHASFRQFHTYIPGYVNFIANDGVILKTMKLSDTIPNSKLLEENYNNVLRGMLQDPMENKHLGYSEELRNLFTKNKCGVGIDLFSLDVTRGRDVGVPPYIDFFEKCGHDAIKSWDDLQGYMDDDNLQLLMKIYTDVEDVDLVVGTLLERKSFGILGAIGACILGEQFYRLKFGNRFFYTFQDSPYPFTPEQIQAITNVTYADVICWTSDSDLTKVPRNALEIPGENNPPIECNSVPAFNMSSFKGAAVEQPDDEGYMAYIYSYFT